MAYNYQQVPFWDFIRNFDQNGAGVDHPAGGFFGQSAGGAPGSHPQHGFGQFGFPFGGSAYFGGPGAWGRGGYRGRCHRREGSHEHAPHGSHDASPNSQQPEGEAREGSPHAHAHHGPHHGPGRHGRRGCWGGPGHNRGPPPFAMPGAGGFDLSALIESLSAHPIAQAFSTYAQQATGNRSGETLVPEENDAENSFTPPIDVFSTPASYILHVALPGAKKEDVGVNWDVEKGVLNLAGVVYRQGDEAFLKTLSQSERKVGVFERTIKLPPGTEEKEEVDGDAITAKLEDGVLIVTVPKVEKEWTEVKKVDIE